MNDDTVDHNFLSRWARFKFWFNIRKGDGDPESYEDTDLYQPPEVFSPEELAVLGFPIAEELDAQEWERGFPEWIPDESPVI